MWMCVRMPARTHARTHTEYSAKFCARTSTLNIQKNSHGFEETPNDDKVEFFQAVMHVSHADSHQVSFVCLNSEFFRIFVRLQNIF
jgi:hypothetical protein